jgi:hypothetical protein
MKVADLQQFLRQIGPFAKAAGASEKASSDLDRAGQCLEPFREHSIADFSDFLSKTVEHYTRTGEFAQIIKPAKGRAKASAPKPPKISLTDAAATFQSLYDRATDPALEYSMIDAEIDKFKDAFTIAQLKELAKLVGITLAGKASKPLILDAFKRRIKELKGSHERNQFRPND